MQKLWNYTHLKENTVRAAPDCLMFFKNSSSPGGSLEFLSYWRTPKHCMSRTGDEAEIVSFAHPFNALLLSLPWLYFFHQAP